MPFRSKLKKAFSRTDAPAGESQPQGGTNAGVSAAIAKRDKAAKKHKWNAKSKEWDNWPEHLYKPYEIPEPKYKRPPQKEHTRNLEKFSWDPDAPASAAGDNRRRGSAGSEYSPMGSRLASRRSSGVGPDGAPVGPSPLAAAAAGDTGGGDEVKVEGVDPNEDAEVEEEDGGPLAKTDTIRAAPGAAVPAKSPAAAASDAFDSSDLTRALTAIQDGGKGHAPATATAVGA